MNNNEKDFETTEEVKAKKVSLAEKRDASKDKKKIKKGILIILAVFAALLLIWGALWVVDWFLHRPPEERELNPMLFFEPDYDKNIYEDEAYMVLNRNIYFDYMGFERVITEENADDYPDKGAEAAKMFVDYFNCIIDGDYENYSSFFTEECLDDKNFELPEKFTMQGLYDIHVEMSHSPRIVDGKRLEVYEVRYRIFENNGTFRDDIYPDETRTLVFGVEVFDGEAKISAIAHRAEG
jgi:hypothetical protein